LFSYRGSEAVLIYRRQGRKEFCLILTYYSALPEMTEENHKKIAM
jgi:hypothetical protein